MMIYEGESWRRSRGVVRGEEVNICVPGVPGV